MDPLATATSCEQSGGTARLLRAPGCGGSASISTSTGTDCRSDPIRARFRTACLMDDEERAELWRLLRRLERRTGWIGSFLIGGWASALGLFFFFQTSEWWKGVIMLGVMIGGGFYLQNKFEKLDRD